MLRTNSQVEIVSEEQLVPRANRLVIKKNNQHVASDSLITDTMLIFVVEILIHHKLYNPVSLSATVPIIYLHQFWTTINHNKNNYTFTFELDTHTFTLTPGLLRTVLQMPPLDPNNTYTKPPSEIQILEFIKILVKSGRGKGFMCYGDQVANVPNKLKKDVVPRKTRSLTIAEETVVGTAVEDLAVQSLLDLRKGSKASRLESLRQKKQPVAGEGSSVAHNKYNYSSDTASDATLYYSSSDESEESENETDDAYEFDMDLSNDNPHKYDDVARCSSNKKFNAGNVPEQECSSYTISISKEYFLSYNNSPTKLTSNQSKEADAKGKKEYKKFKEYDQKLEALTNFNVSEAFEKAVQAKVLTEIKKLLPTHIPNAIANYVKPRLNTSVLEVMKTNQINLFTQSSTSTDDLSEMDLKLKLLNRIHLNKSNDTHTTHQQLYDTLYESIILDQDALDAQAAQSSFHKRSHDNQDPPNNREGENKKKRRKDVGEPSSRSSRRNRSPVVIVQDDTPAMQPLNQAIFLSKNIPNKNDIDKDENHILGPSTIAIAKKFKELIQKDELLIADLEGA
ncbi:hypothetical protein Tco_0860940 [Tanacetum coccineum]|uniref:Uncharacterized protein n=1 Tax=Tanacetum coccineum TaxID=301880 RepID=A0ABQ5BH82_9ASTR